MAINYAAAREFGVMLSAAVKRRRDRMAQRPLA
jgi:hypothetical protein